MDDSGRYYVRDLESGRLFCVEPIRERNQKADGDVFRNGGITGDGVKNVTKGGSITEAESVITPENGYEDIRYVPAGVSPMDIIKQMLKK